MPLLPVAIGTAVAESKTAAASDLEKEAAAKLRRSELELNEKRNDKEKAEVFLCTSDNNL